MIELQNITYSYTRAHPPALKGISCALPQGAFIGILGPNGSGKTTLLKVMSGLLKPGQGTLLWNQKNITHLTLLERARLMAYVAQSEDIFLPYTVRQIVMMGRAPYLGWMGFEQKQDHEILQKCLRLTNTQDFESRLIQNLSGGEQQRVFLARALAQETSTLILDEPTSHLDLKHQIDFFNLIQKLQQESARTVVMTLHDINLALRYCTHLVFIKNGSLVASGATDQLITSELLSTLYDYPLSVVTLNGDNQKWVKPQLS